MILSRAWSLHLRYFRKVKSITKKQLDLWGIDYFDLFLVHFPIAIQYVDPGHRYPPEWFGDDGKVHLRECLNYAFLVRVIDLVSRKYANERDLGCDGRTCG